MNDTQDLRGPVRVTLSRKKGWRMPPNTMSVARPHALGNPHRVGFCPRCGVVHSQQEAVDEFAAMFEGDPFLAAITEQAIRGTSKWWHRRPKTLIPNNTFPAVDHPRLVRLGIDAGNTKRI